MTDLRTAAQQALEALEARAVNRYFEHLGETIAALKAALEQTVQEPVAWTTMPDADDWMFVSGTEKPPLPGEWHPLYTHPPRRETEPAFDALVAISLLTHLGGEVADYEDVVEAVRRLHALNGELLEALKYHQEQTRPIERTRAAIARAEGKV
jgi:hypothetical protein